MLWLQRLIHPTVIAIRDGRSHPAKGRLPSPKLRDLDAILGDFDIRSGSIAIDGTGRLHFSSTIPEKAHQRLRNVLAGS